MQVLASYKSEKKLYTKHTCFLVSCPTKKGTKTLHMQFLSTLQKTFVSIYKVQMRRASQKRSWPINKAKFFWQNSKHYSWYTTRHCSSPEYTWQQLSMVVALSYCQGQDRNWSEMREGRMPNLHLHLVIWQTHPKQLVNEVQGKQKI